MKTNSKPEKEQNKKKQKTGVILLEQKECTEEPKRRSPNLGAILK